MKKFAAVEGLRGWLAWFVVASHIVQISGVTAKGFGPAAVAAGSAAVLVFVIISGFVITHLVVEKPEPYIKYLHRRFFRIFPLFLVSCIVGFFTSDIYAAAISHLPWAYNPDIGDNKSKFIAPFSTYTDMAKSDHDFFWPNATAHLTMLHGMISNRILPFSQYAFNAPAWSLSLEWQFYVLAPLAVAIARQKRFMISGAIVPVALEIACRFGFLGDFNSPSFLPAVAGYFALGIASRLACPLVIGSVRQPLALCSVIMVLLPLGWDAAPLLVWALVMVGITHQESDADSVSFSRTYRLAFESTSATYFGSRSYSIYLCHMPVLAVCLWFLVDRLALAEVLGKATLLVGLFVTVVPLTMIVAEFSHRCIERPGMALGSALLRRRWAAAQLNDGATNGRQRPRRAVKPLEHETPTAREGGV